VIRSTLYCLSLWLLYACKSPQFVDYQTYTIRKNLGTLMQQAIFLAMGDSTGQMKAYGKTVAPEKTAVYVGEGQCNREIVYRLAGLCRKSGDNIDSSISAYESYHFPKRGIGNNYYEVLDRIKIGNEYDFVLICCGSDPKVAWVEIVQLRGYQQSWVSALVGICNGDTVEKVTVWTK